jgi:uncharacterized protein YjbI with pentapeptide repeats
MATCRINEIHAELAKCEREAIGPDGLCILHTHTFPRDETLFESEIQKKLDKEDYDFSGILFSKPFSFFKGQKLNNTVNFIWTTFSEEADFSMTIFTKEADFSRAVFRNKADFSEASLPDPTKFNAATFLKNAYFLGANFKNAFFSSAKFMEKADFRRATFTEGADFSEVTFTAEADFSGAYFAKGASFYGAIFKEGADFSKGTFTEGAGFIAATFTAEADFSGAYFAKGANFHGATFTAEAGFYGATFRGLANFSRAIFTKEANFSRASFTERSNFSGARIEGRVVFRDLNPLGEGELPPAFRGLFRDLELSPGAVLSFQDLSLARVRFTGTDLRRVEFHHVQWHPYRGRQAVYEEVLLRQEEKKKPWFRTWLLYHVPYADIPHPWGDEYGQVERLYRYLKINYETGGDYKNAGDFHYGEMEMHRRAGKWRWFPLYWYNLYRWLSGYGERPSWALGWLCGFLAFFTGFLAWTGMEITDPKHVPAFGDSFFYLLQKVTLQRPDWAYPVGFWGKLVAGLSVLIIPGQAALFILALRNRLGRRR